MAGRGDVRPFVAAAALLACLSCGTPGAPPQAKPQVRITSGAQGGGAIAFAEALADVYRRRLADVVVEVQPSGGALANLDAIQAGTADIGFTFADRAYEAVAASAGTAGADRIRAIAVLQVSPAYLVLRPTMVITSLADLRGRRVGVNAQGQGGTTFDLVLDAYGMTRRDLQLTGMVVNEAAAQLLAGQLDAYFVVGGFASPAMLNAVRQGVTVHALRGAPIEGLLRRYPFFRPAFVPPGTFPNVTWPLQTVGVNTLLVCRRDLDEHLVHELTRVFFEALPALAASQNILQVADLDQAPASPIPLHPGAARYYRERELTR